MHSSKSFGLLAACIFTAAVGAQTITNASPAVVGFIDISTTGGTSVGTVTDDSEHSFVTTVGNALFPAGNVRVGSNGAAVSGITTGDIGFTNAAIPATGLPSGMPAGGSAYLLPFWDDLYPVAATAATTIWWQEDTTNGILLIMWKDQGHITAVAGQTITMEIQVFQNPGAGPWIQFLYPDATFGGTHAAFDNGLSATVGWIKGSNPIGQNTQFSFNTASIPDATVLSIFPPMLLTMTSPFGPGSIQIDISNGPGSGTYFFCVTFNAGAFPLGYFFGIEPSIQEIVSQASTGFPFVGPLDPAGAFTLGPIAGAPSGLTIYSVALGFDTAILDVPSLKSAPNVYTIP
jgi:hypothetical protein